MSNSMDDISQKAETFFVIGSNTTEQHPVFGTMLRRAVRFRGAKLIVADPRRIDLCDFATLHLQQKPGSDIALLNGLMYIILEKSWEAKEFIAERGKLCGTIGEAVKKHDGMRGDVTVGLHLGAADGSDRSGIERRLRRELRQRFGVGVGWVRPGWRNGWLAPAQPVR